MKLVLKKEHQELVTKLEIIRQLLSKENSNPTIQDLFSIEELENEVQKLQSLFDQYNEVLDSFEEVSLKYQFQFNKNVKNLRVKFRKLNNQLENEIPERNELGLPPKSPNRTKSSSPQKDINRSKYYSSYKAR